jgi:hypothetical protein
VVGDHLTVPSYLCDEDMTEIEEEGGVFASHRAVPTTII